MCMTIKEKYIDPFTDFGFKWLFGTEAHKELLISFLNDLLDIQYPIVDIQYRNLEKMGVNIVDRKAIFDIYCTDERNNNFIVELQRSKQKYFKDRSVYYTSFPIQEQSKKGDWDYRLKKVFFVGILEFEMEENHNNEKYLSKVQLFDAQTKEPFFEKLTYYYIEMPKFKKLHRELSNHLEKWLYFLSNLTEFNTIPEVFKDDAVITKAFNLAEFLALDKEEQFSYQSDLKARLDYKNVMDYAREEAEKQGEKIGMEIGMEKGEQKKAIEIAKNLLLKGLDATFISENTGLSMEEIEVLEASI